MNRNKFDKQTITVFDVIGSFFVDVFYNNHYIFAKNLVDSGRAESITDAYRSTIVNYMSGVASRKDLYMSVVKSLHEYYQKTSGFSSVVFSDFEDKFISLFIPPEYYRDFTEKRKDSTLHEIIVKSVNEFGSVILQPKLIRNVIDDHRNTINVTHLQDIILDIFIIQREEYYSKFAREISKKNTRSPNDVILEKIKQKLVEETRKRIEAEANLGRAMSIIPQLVANIDKLKADLVTSHNNTQQMFESKQIHAEVEQKQIKSQQSITPAPLSTKPTTSKQHFVEQVQPVLSPRVQRIESISSTSSTSSEEETTTLDFSVYSQNTDYPDNLLTDGSVDNLDDDIGWG
jgi:hypothetical protein